MWFKIVLFVVSTTLLSENVFAAYDENSNCTFYKPGIRNCAGLTTSDVSDYIGYFLNGAENYALIKHPYGIWILIDVDYVWTPSTASDLFGNGVFAYVILVNGIYYVRPGIGCGIDNDVVLTCDPNKLVDTTRTITYADLYEAVVEERKYSHNVPCNVLERRTLYGPSPVQQNFITGANELIHTTSLQSCILTAKNGTAAEFARGAQELANKYGLAIKIKPVGKYDVMITENRSPQAPPCVAQNFDLFRGIKDFSPFESRQPNSGCWLTTLIAQGFTSPRFRANGPLIYVEIWIFERQKIGTVWFPGYLTTSIFLSYLDALFSGC